MCVPTTIDIDPRIGTSPGRRWAVFFGPVRRDGRGFHRDDAAARFGKAMNCNQGVDGSTSGELR